MDMTTRDYWRAVKRACSYSHDGLTARYVIRVEDANGVHFYTTTAPREDAYVMCRVGKS